MRIKHNIAAKNSYRNLGQTNRALSKNLEKLSTGYRINRAADDAAGLSISEKMKAQISGMDQAQENAEHGIGLLNVMDGALQEYHNILQRMNVLAHQSANGTLEDTVDRPALQAEFDHLLDELTRIANSSEYNNIACFSPTIKDVVVPTKPTLDVVFVLDRTGSMGTHIQRVADNLNDFIDQMDDADLRIGIVDYADNKANGAPEIETYAFSRDFAAVQAQLTALTRTSGGTESGLDAIMEALNLGFRADAAKHIILLADEEITSRHGHTCASVAQELRDANTNLTIIGTTTSVSNDIGTQALTQGLVTPDNFLDKINTDFSSDLLKLGGKISATLPQEKPTTLVDLDPITLQIGDTPDQTMTINRRHMLPERYNLHNAKIIPAEKAIETMGKILAAIDGVSDYRGELGAETNRLEHTINSLGVTIENLTDALSTLRDTDMADEYSDYIKHTILTQSGQAMLAQANQTPQQVLSLMQ